MTITLQVVHVPDCPGVEPLLERLREATDLPVAVREVSTAAAAAEAGMHGSPTLLVNGRDPFVDPDRPGRGQGLSCRIHRDENGRTAPAPSVGQIRAAVCAVG